MARRVTQPLRIDFDQCGRARATLFFVNERAMCVAIVSRYVTSTAELSTVGNRHAPTIWTRSTTRLNSGNGTSSRFGKAAPLSPASSPAIGRSTKRTGLRSSTRVTSCAPARKTPLLRLRWSARRRRNRPPIDSDREITRSVDYDVLWRKRHDLSVTIGSRLDAIGWSLAMGDTELDGHIRRRAYEIWESEGRPIGRDRAHWLRAETEIREGLKGAASGPAPAKPARKAPGKAAPSSKPSAGSRRPPPSKT